MILQKLIECADLLSELKKKTFLLLHIFLEPVANFSELFDEQKVTKLLHLFKI